MFAHYAANRRGVKYKIIGQDIDDEDKSVEQLKREHSEIAFKIVKREFC
jgi:hypothetical protein